MYTKYLQFLCKKQFFDVHSVATTILVEPLEHLMGCRGGSSRTMKVSGGDVQHLSRPEAEGSAGVCGARGALHDGAATAQEDGLCRRAGFYRQLLATCRAESSRGWRDRRKRADGRHGSDAASTADARLRDDRRRDRGQGVGAGSLLAACRRDGCGGTAAGPPRQAKGRKGALRPVRCLCGRGCTDEAGDVLGPKALDDPPRRKRNFIVIEFFIGCVSNLIVIVRTVEQSTVCSSNCKNAPKNF